MFLENLKLLFDIAAPNIEKYLSTDRIRKNLGLTSEELSFLEDQRGPRKMIIGEEDTDFGLRSKEQAERYKKTRARPSETETPTSCSKAQKLEVQSDEEPDLNTEADGDGDYQPASERREPRSDMSSPGLVAMLDQQKVSTYGATGLTAAYIKGFKSLDGKDLNL